MKGFYNRMITIDLTEQTSHETRIEDDIYQRFLGGKGLGSYLLNKLNPTGIDPLSPENRLILTTGPATDSAIHGCTRYGVFTKSPLTGLYSEAYSGGKAATPMSRTGYDAIVFEGASETPIYVEINPEVVQFHDASDLWGKGTYDTEDSILKKTGVKGARAIVIGPAGENKIHYAVIENEKWRSAGRTGVGAVMGSKNLKGVVFHGDKSRELADQEGIKKFTRKIMKEHKDSPGALAFRNNGTPVMVGILNDLGAFPTKYWTSGVMEDWETLGAERLHSDHNVKPRACANCFIACSRYTTVAKGRHKGLTIEGPEYETIYAFGGLCLIKDLGEVIYLNDLCDNLGMDTITAGNVIAFLMEATERGLSKYPVKYGDVDKTVQLLNDIAYRRGIGELLAKGVKEIAREWDCEDLAIHVKGLEPAGYDPRSLTGMGLAYATAERGACHLRSTFYKAEMAGISPPDEIEDKAAHFIDFEDRLNLMDALIVCRFYRDIYLWDELADMIRMTTGLDVDRKALKEVAFNIKSQANLFNQREGVKPEDEELPSRFFTEPLTDSNKVYKKDTFEKLMNDYTSLRGLKP